MEYPGYILSNNLPSVKAIHSFTDELINYLFPVTDEPEMFLQYKGNAAPQPRSLVSLCRYNLRDRSPGW